MFLLAEWKKKDWTRTKHTCLSVLFLNGSGQEYQGPHLRNCVKTQITTLLNQFFEIESLKKVQKSCFEKMIRTCLCMQQMWKNLSGTFPADGGSVVRLWDWRTSNASDRRDHAPTASLCLLSRKRVDGYRHGVTVSAVEKNDKGLSLIGLI